MIHFRNYKTFEPDFESCGSSWDKGLCWLNGYESMRQNALKPRMIRDAFADWGIFPFDLSRLIQPPQVVEVREPTTDEETDG